MFLRPRMTRTGGHAGPYVWGGVTGVTGPDNPWLTAVQENTATRLVVSANSYDAEQRFLVNENPLSVRTALGVGLGSAGCAGPVFAPDKYGPAMWLDQTLGTAFVSAVAPAVTSANVWSLAGGCDSRTGVSFYTARIVGAAGYALVSASGYLQWYDGTTYHASSAPVASLTGVAVTDPWEWVFEFNGTNLDAYVRALGSSTWVSAMSGKTLASAISIEGKTVLPGYNSTVSSGYRGKVRALKILDGGRADSVVAEFTPGLFVGGNRADGDTAVDAYGVTWTITRPAATTDMPRVMVGGSEQYISLPGVAGEYLSTPDTAALSITGDIDIRAKAALDDWSSGAAQTLVSKWTTSGNQRSYQFLVTSTGNLQFAYTTGGVSGVFVSSVGTVPFNNGEIGWVRVTVDVDNGASDADVKFYTSTDGITWTQLGSTINPGSTISIFDSTAVLEVGSIKAGSAQLLVGDVNWVEVYDGVDGTLVERIDAAEADPNSTTWTSSTSGATVTVNKSASAQYHATVVPPNTTIVQGDGVNDFAQVVGDDTITDFVPATGLTVMVDMSIPAADSYAALWSSADASTNDGVKAYLESTNPRITTRVDDGTTVGFAGDATDNITFGARFLAAAAFGDSDHEAYVDGSSKEQITSAVTAQEAAGPLLFLIHTGGTNPLAADFYGAAVLGERTSDTEAAAYATEGLTR